MCLVLSGSVGHFDVALLWKFVNNNDLIHSNRSVPLVSFRVL